MQADTGEDVPYDYESVIDELIQNGLITKDQAFFYSDHPLGRAFDQIFQSAQKNLSVICPGHGYGIEPARFFFFNKKEVNATAYPRENGYYRISINGETLVQLYAIFCGSDAIADPDLVDYQRLDDFYREPPFSISVSYIMFQAASLFAYYHELGHLIQFSNYEGGIRALQERYMTGQQPFNIGYHIVEYDADIHGAQEVARHVMEFYDTLPASYRNYDNLNKLITLALVGILGFYMMLLDRPNSRIYYYEGRHPHPLIRIQWIYASLLGRVQVYFPDLNPTDAIRETLRVLDVFFRYSNRGNIKERFEMPLRENIGNIMSYIKNIIHTAEHPDFSYLAINSVHKR